MLKVSVILSRIRGIKNGTRKLDTKVGVCENIGVPLIPKHALKNWEHYSLDCLYPVPSGEKGVTPEFKYISTVHSKETNLWDKNTKYGQFRWKLLDYLEEYYNDCTLYVVTPYSVIDIEDCTKVGDICDGNELVLVKDSLVGNADVAEALGDLAMYVPDFVISRGLYQA